MKWENSEGLRCCTASDPGKSSEASVLLLFAGILQSACEVQSRPGISSFCNVTKNWKTYVTKKFTSMWRSSVAVHDKQMSHNRTLIVSSLWQSYSVHNLQQTEPIYRNTKK